VSNALLKSTKEQYSFFPKEKYIAIRECKVKQGENMSPFLFSLFLNDLETFFLENNISDLEQISKKMSRHNCMLFKNIQGP
jgi:hypothetical protein